MAGLPRVLLAGLQDEPRVVAVAIAYLRAVDGIFSAPTFRTFVHALQAHEPLTLHELWDLASFLKFALLESLLDEARALRRTPESVSLPAFSARIRSLRDVGNADWVSLIEPFITFDSLLFQYPSGAYRCMDFDSREFYRKRVAMIARRSDCTEALVAQTALDLSREGGQHALSNHARNAAWTKLDTASPARDFPSSPFGLDFILPFLGVSANLPVTMWRTFT